MTTQLVWYKRDLRVSDHAPLARAAKEGDCICLYVYEPEIVEAEDFDEAHLKFINEGLIELRDNLRKRGGELLLRVGSMPDVLKELGDTISYSLRLHDAIVDCTVAPQEGVRFLLGADGQYFESPDL